MYNGTRGSHGTSVTFLLGRAGRERSLTLRAGYGSGDSPLLQNPEPARNEAGPAASPVTTAEAGTAHLQTARTLEGGPGPRGRGGGPGGAAPALGRSPGRRPRALHRPPGGRPE